MSSNDEKRGPGDSLDGDAEKSEMTDDQPADVKIPSEYTEIMYDKNGLRLGPYERANVCSKIFWTFMQPLMSKGMHHPVGMDDFGPLAEFDHSDVSLNRLKATWSDEMEIHYYNQLQSERIKKGERPTDDPDRPRSRCCIRPTQPYFLRAIVRAYGPDFMLQGLWLLVYSGCKIGSALLLQALVNYIGEDSSLPGSHEQWYGYVLAVSLALVALVQACIHHQVFFRSSRHGLRARVASCALLYEKALTLHSSSFVTTSTGTVTNLMSVDTRRFDDATPFMHYLWEAPLESIVVLYLIYREIGVAMFFGAAVVVAVVPIQFWFSRQFGAIRRVTMKHMDQRVKYVNEILVGTEIVKMYNWEEPMEKVVQSERKNELNSIKNNITFHAINLAGFLTASMIVNLVTWVGYTQLGNTLTPAVVFTTISFFGAILFPMIQFVPFAVQSTTEMTIACARIEKFLILDANNDQKLNAYITNANKNTDATNKPKPSTQQGNRTQSPNGTKGGDSVDSAGDRKETEGIEMATFSKGDDGSSQGLPVGSVLINGVSFYWPEDASEVEEKDKKGKESGRSSQTLTSQPTKSLISEDAGRESSSSSSSSAIVSSSSSLPLSASTSSSALSIDTSASPLPSSSPTSPSSLSSPTSPTSPNSPTSPTPPTLLTAPGLRNVKLSIKPGQLVAVVGSVGSFKSSLLQALLGEMPVGDGSFPGTSAHPHPFISGKCAYAPQKPWMFAASIRDNILFGSEYDAARYRKVVKVCGLERDFELFHAGDHTIIGERGVNLSGGQRARIALARACYAIADVYLLDDVLAAVDQVVSRHIFEKALSNKGFLRGKTRILVTHQTHLLPMVDHILILNRGQIVGQGTFAQLREKGLLELPTTPHATPSAHGHGASPTNNADSTSTITPFNLSSTPSGPGTAHTPLSSSPPLGPTSSAPISLLSPTQLIRNRSLSASRPAASLLESSTAATHPTQSPTPLGSSLTASTFPLSPPSHAPTTSEPLDVNVVGLNVTDRDIESARLGALDLTRDISLPIDENEENKTITNGIKSTPLIKHEGDEKSSMDGQEDQSRHRHRNGSHSTHHQHHHHHSHAQTELSRRSSRHSPSLSAMDSEFEAAAQAELADIVNKAAGAEKNIIKEEDRAVGTVDASVYKRFFFGGAPAIIVILIFMLVVGSQVLKINTDWWLAGWSNDTPEGQYLDKTHYTNIFIILSLATMLAMLIRPIIFMRMVLQASASAHDHMFKGVLYSPMSFFQANPTGRVLNRFSKDQGVLDEQLPGTIFDTTQTLVSVLGTMAVVGMVAPYVLLSLLIVVPLFFYVREQYVRTSREVKRLDATTRSPVFSLFSSSLSGLAVIRAFGRQHEFQATFTKLLDENSRAFYVYCYISRWLGVRLDGMSSSLLLITAIFCVAVKDTLEPAAVGFVLTYLTSIVTLFQWMVRQSAEAENQMTSAERVLAYANLPSEGVRYGSIEYPASMILPPSEVTNKSDSTTSTSSLTMVEKTNDMSAALASASFSPTTSDDAASSTTEQKVNEKGCVVYSPPKHWPDKGRIELHHVVMAYRPELPPVLKDLSVVFAAGEKIGVCGRTGAGKSSLFVTLFRLCNISSGKILLDGVDIHRIGLADLRSSLAIIPQSPVIFSGSLRYNLDPFNVHTDAAVIAALEKVQLGYLVNDLPNGLHTLMAEQGSNLSVGEGQLLCIARALLKPSKLLFVDEATANVDGQTDKLIQRVLRSEFKDRTVITIAHRLQTIITCDRIVVLDSGQVAETGTPKELMAKKDGLFATMLAAQREKKH